MGGTHMDAVNAGLASKDRTMEGILDYYRGRDSKYAEIMKSEQQMMQQAGTMDMIGKLLAGAAMLAG